MALLLRREVLPYDPSIENSMQFAWPEYSIWYSRDPTKEEGAIKLEQRCIWQQFGAAKGFVWKKNIPGLYWLFIPEFGPHKDTIWHGWNFANLNFTEFLAFYLKGKPMS